MLWRFCYFCCCCCWWWWWWHFDVTLPTAPGSCSSWSRYVVAQQHCWSHRSRLDRCKWDVSNVGYRRKRTTHRVHRLITLWQGMMQLCQYKPTLTYSGVAGPQRLGAKWKEILTARSWSIFIKLHDNFDVFDHEKVQHVRRRQWATSSTRDQLSVP